MNKNEILESLRQQAVKFHQALIDGKVYVKNIDKQEFLFRIDKLVDDNAERIVENVEGLELSTLALPVNLLYVLEDVLPFAIWDYEFGYDGFFDDLNKLFSKTSHIVEWGYDSEASQLKYSLDNQTWTINNLEHTAEVDPEIYSEILDNINNYLQKQDEILYAAVTGDQTGLLILVPSNSLENLKDFLISNDDPRASMFY
jgi:hypothetical protein